MLLIITDTPLLEGSILLDKYSNSNYFSFCRAYTVVEEVSSKKAPEFIMKTYNKIKTNVYIYSLEDLVDINIDNYKELLYSKYNCDFNNVSDIKVYKSDVEFLSYKLFEVCEKNVIANKLVKVNNKYLKIRK